MEVRHPYFKGVHITSVGTALVSLSDKFPINSFTLKSIPLIWEGVEEVMADIVFVHESGEPHVITGSGGTFEEAVQTALILFVNLVIHPEGLNGSHFVRTRGIRGQMTTDT